MRKLLLTLFLPLLFPLSAFAATPTIVGTATTSSDTTTGNNYSFSYNVDGTGSNMALVVIPQTETGDPTLYLGCNYGSYGMSKLISLSTASVSAIVLYFLPSPPTGSNTLSCNFNGVGKKNVMVFQLKDVVQAASSTIDATTAATLVGPFTDTWTATLTTTVDNDLAVSMVNFTGAGDIGVHATGSGQVDITSIKQGSSPGIAISSYTPTTSAGNYTLSYAGAVNATWGEGAITSFKYQAPTAPVSPFTGWWNIFWW